MRWELKARAAERGIASAAEMRRRLAGHGLRVSAGKMSHLWSGTPLTVRLEDLDFLCAVLACRPSDLLVPEEPAPPPHFAPAAGHQPPVPPLLPAAAGLARTRLVPPL
ncbi:helix-turn-helix transcriptional regulator [Streptomyces chartreusis]|uniref:helix-turn-helix domain-containing protein n=1 Tax=Streptomyces chartreusis TaxID=1969 RepID=UPI002E8036C6|nr:helix-turn-helix transcriptional regulator [Streptomyces chartreusis]WUB23785.1 helix-turn-helix transcriptional regulator [Streptomyces chartreusis]